MGNKLETLRKRNIAKKLLLRGFKNTLVVLHSGVPDATVRSLRDELKASRQLDDVKGVTNGQIRASNLIIANRYLMAEGGLFLRTYITIAEDPENSLDIDALYEAHTTYLEFHKLINSGLLRAPLSLNEVYALARDYRSRDDSIKLYQCPKPSCKTHYIVVAGQRMKGGCPMCAISGK